MGTAAKVTIVGIAVAAGVAVDGIVIGGIVIAGHAIADQQNSPTAATGIGTLPTLQFMKRLHRSHEALFEISI